MEQMTRNSVRTIPNLFQHTVLIYLAFSYGSYFYCRWMVRQNQVSWIALVQFSLLVNIKLSMVLCKIWFQLVMLVIYRIAARYLHNNFLNRKKGREEEVMSLLRVLEGRTKKESAKLFYEILVCPTCL